MTVYGNVEIEGAAYLHKNVRAISFGHHLAAELADSHIHSHAHSEISGGATTVDVAIPFLSSYIERQIF